MQRFPGSLKFSPADEAEYLAPSDTLKSDIGEREVRMYAKNAAFAVAVALVATQASSGEASEAPASFKPCAVCHSTTAGANGVGPSLAGVYGKRAGTRSGYKYSDKMVQSGLTWDAASLTKFIADPKGTVPGSKMAFAGMKKPDDMIAVVNYLKTLK